MIQFHETGYGITMKEVLDWCVCPYCDKKIKVVE